MESVDGLQTGAGIRRRFSCASHARLMPTPRVLINEDVLRKTHLIFAVISFILATFIFVFGTGASRVYSGVFFVLLGITILAKAKRGSQDNKS